MDERVYHYVRTNETTRMPRRHIMVDSESRSVRVKGGHVQAWRLAVAHFVNAPKGKTPVERRESYTTAEALWTAVDGFCGKRARTILWAHNIGYDVRIADAFTVLPSLGWRLVGHNLAPRGTWLVWRRGDANLTMVDTAAVWPTSLREIGLMFGMGKKPLPKDEDDEAAWLARCHSDVDILVRAVSSYLEWLEKEDMGNFQLTGASQSYAAFRHRWLTHPMLVHADAEALEAERRAMWTGRCEAYWHGTILRQVIHEWDLSAAYAYIARDLDLPVRLVGIAGQALARRTIENPQGHAILAQVTVDTDVPVVPTAHDGRILWPTGRFDSVLWDLEIREAVAAGAQVTIHKGWIYRTAPALREWATWILESLAAPDDVVLPWQYKIIKHWSRALIGRFAMRYAQWEEWGAMPHVGAERRLLEDDIEGETYDILHIGHQLWRQRGDEEWSQSQPAITGYVMAACRVRLWQIMQALPREAVLYVDTDSLLATDRWHNQIAALADTSMGQGLRLKRSWDGFSIYGPRQVVTGERVRLAGVPLRARRIERHKFEGEVWESLEMALRRGDPSQVRISDRVWTPAGVDRRRVGIGIGWTRPFRIDTDT